MIKMKRNEKNGRLLEEYTPDLLIKTLEQVGGKVTPTQVANKLGCSQRLANQKLRKLFNTEKINGEKIHNRWYFWPK